MNQLGYEAGLYDGYFKKIGYFILISLIFAMWGRLVFIRALTLSMYSDKVPGSNAFRIGVVPFASYVYVGLFFEALFFVSGPLMPFVALSSGLAAATAFTIKKPGLIAPLKQVQKAFAEKKILLILFVIFLIAWFIAMYNLYFLFQFGLWLISVIPGIDITAWERIFDPGNYHFKMILYFGALLFVEPFWLAAISVYVHKLGLAKSGEDLKYEFNSISGMSRK